MNYLAMSAPVQAFLGKEGAGLIDYSDFGVQGVKDASDKERTKMMADALVDIAEYEGEAYKEAMEYRTAADLALKGPQKPSGFQRAMGMVQDGLSIAGGLKDMGAFGSGFGATEGVNPNTIVDSFGGQASGLPGNDFYVDSSGGIFPTP